MMLLAIDPGNTMSAYVLMDVMMKPLLYGKVENETLMEMMPELLEQADSVAIEMIASYGMAVGATVFDTCVWIGRFTEKSIMYGKVPTRIFRKDVKMNLCNSTRAKDSNVTQALVDRFAYPRHKDRNHGKGTKADPGWFYKFSKDVWAAYAVGVTYLDNNSSGFVEV